MSDHAHVWAPQPEFSGRMITRYRCACGVWGWRNWRMAPGGKLPPVVTYANGFDTETYRAAVARSEINDEERWAKERRRRARRGLEPPLGVLDDN